MIEKEIRWLGAVVPMLFLCSSMMRAAMTPNEGVQSALWCALADKNGEESWSLLSFEGVGMDSFNSDS